MLLSVDRSDAKRHQSLSYEIVDAVAEREGVDATEIEPPEYEALYDVLNPEALEALFAPREDGTPRNPGRVEFTFCGYDMVVTSDGDVTVIETE
ncbi:HalOD1 output domain-containing protein [Natrononativus amylolyticus]|uniref:HalOD1 output domain-containing protein n=1 Tax=Natrononativus amylolyticus TaxID=2963434 RepID=UPI0020CB712B|nr:HalOD1 output domain-containing protein [Natrononativus amylolyticus]